MPKKIQLFSTRYYKKDAAQSHEGKYCTNNLYNMKRSKPPISIQNNKNRGFKCSSNIFLCDKHKMYLLQLFVSLGLIDK